MCTYNTLSGCTSQLLPDRRRNFESELLQRHLSKEVPCFLLAAITGAEGIKLSQVFIHNTRTASRQACISILL